VLRTRGQLSNHPEPGVLGMDDGDRAKGVVAADPPPAGDTGVAAELLRLKRELAIVGRIAEILLRLPDDETYGEVLRLILEATDSRHGVFGYLDEQGDLVCPSMTRGAWQQCRMPEKTIRFPRDSWSGALWCRALRENRSICQNEPGRVPEGHIPIARCAAVPISCWGQVIGVLAVANKRADYDREDVFLLESIAGHIAPILHARLELVRQTRLAAIGQVSASIAHDLRNPLGAVRNAAYYLKRRLPGEQPELVEFLNIIEKEVDSADRIIGGLLDLTRSRPVDKQSVDLGRLVEEAFRRIKETEGVRFRVSADPDPFQVRADPDQLRQVLVNLLMNAVQAMEGKGELLIEANRTVRWDVIVVRDTGPGIPGGVRERAFEPLVTTKTRGTGLGLTICRQIVERHGGGIEFLPGGQRGAAFRITLPRSRENGPGGRENP